MSDITEFVLARIAEDEAKVAKPMVDAPVITTYQPARPRGYGWMKAHSRTEMVGTVVAEPGPDAARVLAQCAAMRRIVNGHGDMNDGDCRTCVRGLWGYPTHGRSVPLTWPCDTIRALASIWSEHPDYQQEWA